MGVCGGDVKGERGQKWGTICTVCSPFLLLPAPGATPPALQGVQNEQWAHSSWTVLTAQCWLLQGSVGPRLGPKPSQLSSSCRSTAQPTSRTTSHSSAAGTPPPTPPTPGLPAGISKAPIYKRWCLSLERLKHRDLPRHFCSRTRREKPCTAPSSVLSPFHPAHVQENSEATGLRPSPLFPSRRPRTVSRRDGNVCSELLPQCAGLSTCQGGLGCPPSCLLLPLSALSFSSLSSVARWNYLANQTSDFWAKSSSLIQTVFLGDCEVASSLIVGIWLISSAGHMPKWE